MKRESDEKLAREMEADAADEGVWVKDPVPVMAEKPRLGVQVSLRLEPESAAILRRIARARRVGYTSLIREWVVERLREEDQSLAEVVLPQATSERGVATANRYSLAGTIRKVSIAAPASRAAVG